MGQALEALNPDWNSLPEINVLFERHGVPLHYVRDDRVDSWESLFAMESGADGSASAG